MKPFHESMRYDYPLSPESVVYDVGAYEGTFAREIYRKHGCRVFCFEPVFHVQLKERLRDIVSAVTVFPFGIGSATSIKQMQVKGDMTGLFAQSDDRCNVLIMDVSEVLKEDAALFKLNCEGSEFCILEAVLERGLATKLKNIQVQPHAVVPDAEKRWAAIQAGLLKTHHLTFDAPWCWQNYELNK